MRKGSTITQNQMILIAIVVILALVGGFYFGKMTAPIDEEPIDEEPIEPVLLRIGYESAPRAVDSPNYGDDFLNGIDQLCHEPLFTLREKDGELVYEKVLVESYEQVDDVTWTFEIKQGIKFSDGSDLDAQDVLWSLWGRNDPRPHNFLWSIDPRFESIEKTGDYTIKIVTSYQTDIIPWLSHGWTDIMSYEWAVATDNLHNYPMDGIPPGTGPYMWTQCEPMLYSKMALNPYWRGETPEITNIELYGVDDDTARVMAFEAGSFDFLHPTPVEAIDDLKAKGYTVLSYNVPMSQVFRLNNQYPPLDDINVRKAIAYAINKDELVETIFLGAATVIDSPACSNTIGYKDYPLYDYNPEKARQILTDAGYTEPIKLDWYVVAAGKNLELAGAIQSYLKEVNIEVNVEVIERSSYTIQQRQLLADYRAGEDVDMSVLDHLGFRAWHTDTMWAGDDLDSLYNSQNPCMLFVNNSELDEILAYLVSQAPLEDRIEACYDAQRVWMENCFGVPLYTQVQVYTVVPELEGVYIAPQMYPWLGECYYTK